MRGAGILFVFRPANGPVRILLARRQNKEKRWLQIYHEADAKVSFFKKIAKTSICYLDRNFNADRWTITGGHFDRFRDHTLLDCAIREAIEETIGEYQSRSALKQYAPVIAALENLRLKKIDEIRILHLLLPFVQWDTYLVELPAIPTNWPGLNHEFETYGWFTLDALPQPLHTLMGLTLQNLRKKINL
jgi:8-oxo-dGTP pyrophosphatase MutT (NUDIX family)